MFNSDASGQVVLHLISFTRNVYVLTMNFNIPVFELATRNDYFLLVSYVIWQADYLSQNL